MNSLAFRIFVVCVALIGQNAFSLTSYTHLCVDTSQESTSTHCEQSQTPPSENEFSPSHCDKDCVCPFLSVSFYSGALETEYSKPIFSNPRFADFLHLAVQPEPLIRPPISSIFYS